MKLWEVRKYQRWKRVLERKGLKVNVEKTKGMQFLHDKKACFEVGSLWCLW